MSKYKAIKTTVGQYQFDSKAEASRFNELYMLQKAGKIKGLTLQPEFVLARTFVIGADFTKSGKSKISELKYTADFKYIERGGVVVEDVKGKTTTDYVIRKSYFCLKRKITVWTYSVRLLRTKLKITT